MKKTNNTAIKALEMLKYMTMSPQTKSDIIKHWEEKENVKDFNGSNIYKYFNTFKLFGLNIERNKGKYSITENFIDTPITVQEEYGLIFITEYARQIFDKEEFEIVKKLTDKLCKKIDNLEQKTNEVKLRYKKVLNVKYDKEKYSLYRKLLKDQQRLSIKYNNKQLNEVQMLTLDLEKIIITPIGIMLRAYNLTNAETQDIYADDIIEVKQLPTKIRPVNIKNSVTFKVTGRLALTYDLKQGERIIEETDDYKTIVNNEEDKEVLLRRLLRYGTSCEIIYPKILRKKAFETLQKIKKLYE